MNRRSLLLTILAPVFAFGAFAQSEAEADSALITILSLVETLSADPGEPEPFSLGALDYLSSVYEDTDYYTNGTSADYAPPRAVDDRIYIHGLPDHLLAQFHHPVRGKITSRFGLRNSGKRMHKGVDISLCRGDSIGCAFNGTVERVGYEKGGYGYFVIVSHPDGVQSRYAHLQCPLAKPGDRVLSGDIIGLGGTSGNSTGPHLHFEIRRYNRPVDPTPLLNKK